jgi:hypothetical protein
MYTPDEWVPPHDEPPHGHKGAHAAFDDSSRLLSAWGNDHG